MGIEDTGVLVNTYINEAYDCVKKVSDNMDALLAIEQIYVYSMAKLPVVAATTDNILLTGLQTIDSVDVVTADRVLVKEQTDATENGIYIVSSKAWTRAPDWTSSSNVINYSVFVDKNSDKIYMVSFTGDFVLDTTEVSFVDIVARDT
jgi:hypothetical protein